MDWSSLGIADTATPQHVILFRLLVAAVLGGMIGFEREARNGQAGLRTHILIATAAALFTTLVFEIFHLPQVVASGNADPIRAVEAVTAGIAFLGAGAIFQQRGSVHGLTTGAGMWLAGAIGVASAMGYYVIAGAVAVFAVLVLFALRAFAHYTLGNETPPPDDDAQAHRDRPGHKTGKDAQV